MIRHVPVAVNALKTREELVSTMWLARTKVWDKYQYLRNFAPTPPLTHHVIIS